MLKEMRLANATRMRLIIEAQTRLIKAEAEKRAIQLLMSAFHNNTNQFIMYKFVENLRDFNSTLIIEMCLGTNTTMGMIRIVEPSKHVRHCVKCFVLPYNMSIEKFASVVRRNAIKLHKRLLNQAKRGYRFTTTDYWYFTEFDIEGYYTIVGRLLLGIVHRQVPALVTFTVDAYKLKNNLWMVYAGDNYDFFEITEDEPLYVEATDNEFTLNDAVEFLTCDYVQKILSQIAQTKVRIIPESSPEFEEYMNTVKLFASEFIQYCAYCILNPF